MPQIAEKMMRGNFQTIPNTREIGALPEGERLVFIVNIHSLDAGFWLLVAG
jgi:hypothetical protein